MKIIESIPEMHEYSQQLKRKGKIIASVDTDAELHDGHMALIKIAKENSDVVVLNAGHSVDYKEKSVEEYNKRLSHYRQMPEGLSRDIELCQSNGVDVFFYPSMSQLYVKELSIPVEMCEKVFDFMKNRDTCDTANFRNMLHVLWTYFPIFEVVTPDISVVGQKDAYQVFGLKFLIKQLNLPIEVVMAPIIRESDGLAYNSRNAYLTQSERQRAISIYQVLQEVTSWSETEPINYIKSYITHHIKSEECYVDICCAETLEDLDVVLDRKAIIIVNAFFGEIELGDNIIIDPK
jgi:pantoate--beta-alanine ligase